jgi:hypothetical protein
MPKEVLGKATVSEFSDHALDTYMAPELSKFTSASIPDVSAYAQKREWWVRNFFLNSMLGTTVDAPVRQYMVNYLRRAELAFQEYELGRERTLNYLETPRGGGIGHYMAAIGHWEVFLGQAWHANQLLSYMVGWNGQGIFSQGDGSPEERLNFLYNRSKHAESSISGDFYPENGTLCLWLYNDGLKVKGDEKKGGHLTFAEIFEILEELGKWADRIEDPGTLREKVLADLASREAGSEADS